MDDEAARLPLDERRRDIYRRSVEKFRALGMPIDSDPTFGRLIEAWIEGSIEMPEVARAYADFRRPGQNIPIAKPALPAVVVAPELSQAELPAELERVIGIFEPEGVSSEQ